MLFGEEKTNIFCGLGVRKLKAMERQQIKEILNKRMFGKEYILP